MQYLKELNMKKIKNWHFYYSTLLLIFISFICPVANADLKELFYQQSLKNSGQKNHLKAYTSSSVQVNYFNQLVDHDNPNMGTFSQRYYVDETYGKDNHAPVLFYICGESECTARDFDGATRVMAKKFKAKLVALEHRYYGKSLPRKTLSTEDLKYLTTEAALKDLAEFQNHLTSEKHWTGKWIAIGGSYPGSLSAYYRAKYPNLVVGSLASSAPVMAKEDFNDYDAHITKVAGQACANEIRAVVKEVEDAVNDPDKLARIKNMFAASNVQNHDDFLELVAEIGAFAIQYGMKDTFCRLITEGADSLASYAKFANLIYNNLGIKAIDLIVPGSVSEDPNDYPNIGMRQWYYQSCTEYGYWQTANSDPEKSTRSALIDLKYYRNACKRLFGIEQPANITHTNEYFYTPLLDEKSVSNILFTNGSDDPWSTLSMSENNSNNTNKNLYYYTIDGSAHCNDLQEPSGRDSSSLKLARAMTENLMKSWLSSH